MPVPIVSALRASPRSTTEFLALKGFIDAVFIMHAVRAVDLGAGTRAMSVGCSQGDGSAAAIAEMGDDDFGDMHFARSVLRRFVAWVPPSLAMHTTATHPL